MIVLRVSCCYAYGSMRPTFNPRSHWIRLPLYHTRTHTHACTFTLFLLLSPFAQLFFLRLPSPHKATHAFDMFWRECLSLYHSLTPFNFTPSMSCFLIFPSVSLSLLSVSLPHSRHTQQTHHHPFNFWPPHNVVPHKKHASITTTVLTHTTHTQTDTERIPLSPKQHARKYSWESLKSYKANMCGECQALNLGSAVICRDVTTLIFLILSSHLNLFFSVFFIVFVSNSSL